MIYRARKGQASYGKVIGILLLDTTFAPYIPGDVANATTYSFPVTFKKVEGLTVKAIFSKDARFLDKVIEASKELVKEGVKAITGDCGFMAIYQKEVAEELDVPIFLSSLLQLPFLTRILGEKKKVGIITANSEALDEELLREVGVKNTDSVSIIGMENKEYFRKAIIEEEGWLDSQKIEKEVIETAKELVENDPRVKTILLECSALPPYGLAVQRAVNMPVFDYISVINYVYSGLVKRKYEGVM